MRLWESSDLYRRVSRWDSFRRVSGRCASNERLRRMSFRQNKDNPDVAHNGARQDKKLKILISLLYYVPHRTGLTIHVQRVAEELARRGHEVTVLTARYKQSLPRDAH